MNTLSALKYAISGAAACAVISTVVMPAEAAGVSRYSGNITDYSPREVAMLPAYCKHTQLFRDRVPGGDDQGEIQRWSSAMGPTFHAMHHYCWGIMDTNRAMLSGSDRQNRDFYLSASIDEFDYVLRNATPDFVMLPEILSRKGENLIRLGRAVQGLDALQRAIEAKADYWPPYASISDYYRNIGDTHKAREVLQQGLRASPDAKALRRRLAQLDGQRAGAAP